MKRRLFIFLFILICLVSCGVSPSQNFIEVHKGYYPVTKAVYNQVYFIPNGAGFVITPNNEIIVMTDAHEADEWKCIREAAEFSGTLNEEVGKVSDLTANAFIIKYNELSGKYKLKEIDVNADE